MLLFTFQVARLCGDVVEVDNIELARSVSTDVPQSPLPAAEAAQAESPNLTTSLTDIYRGKKIGLD